MPLVSGSASSTRKCLWKPLICNCFLTFTTVVAVYRVWYHTVHDKQYKCIYMKPSIVQEDQIHDVLLLLWTIFTNNTHIVELLICWFPTVSSQPSTVSKLNKAIVFNYQVYVQIHISMQTCRTVSMCRKATCSTVLDVDVWQYDEQNGTTLMNIMTQTDLDSSFVSS